MKWKSFQHSFHNFIICSLKCPTNDKSGDTFRVNIDIGRGHLRSNSRSKSESVSKKCSGFELEQDHNPSIITSNHTKSQLWKSSRPKQADLWLVYLSQSEASLSFIFQFLFLINEHVSSPSNILCYRKHQYRHCLQSTTSSSVGDRHPISISHRAQSSHSEWFRSPAVWAAFGPSGEIVFTDIGEGIRLSIPFELCYHFCNRTV